MDAEAVTAFSNAVRDQMMLKGVYALVGLACVWMGYNLFIRGIFEGGTGFQAQAGSEETDTKWYANLALDRGGPGLVFALFGAVVILGSIFKPMSVSATPMITGRTVDGKTETTPAALIPLVRPYAPNPQPLDERNPSEAVRTTERTIQPPGTRTMPEPQKQVWFILDADGRVTVSLSQDDLHYKIASYNYDLSSPYYTYTSEGNFSPIGTREDIRRRPRTRVGTAYFVEADHLLVSSWPPGVDDPFREDDAWTGTGTRWTPSKREVEFRYVAQQSEIASSRYFDEPLLQYSPDGRFLVPIDIR